MGRHIAAVATTRLPTLRLPHSQIGGIKGALGGVKGAPGVTRVWPPPLVTPKPTRPF